MGFFKDLFGGGLKQPSGSSPAGDDGMLAKLFREHAGELQGNKAQYTYDPNTQQYTAMKKGGMTASKRADGIAQRGKTKGKFV